MKTPLEIRAFDRRPRSARNQVRGTVADIEDARIIERAKSASGKHPRIPWAQAKKELGLTWV